MFASSTVPAGYHATMRRSRTVINAPIVAALAASAAAGYYFDDIVSPGRQAALVSNTSGSCDIKGNISIDTGERIFHVPGQEYYSQTIIRPEFGERWFCSEREARAAGWRKSRS